MSSSSASECLEWLYQQKMSQSYSQNWSHLTKKNLRQNLSKKRDCLSDELETASRQTSEKLTTLSCRQHFIAKLCMLSCSMTRNWWVLISSSFVHMITRKKVMAKLKQSWRLKHEARFTAKLFHCVKKIVGPYIRPIGGVFRVSERGSNPPPSPTSLSSFPLHLPL